MEVLTGWMKLILVYRILLLIITQLIPGKRNKSLINTFAGLMLVLIVTGKITSYGQDIHMLEQTVLQKIELGSYSESGQIEIMADKARVQAVLSEYTEYIRKQIESIVDGQNLITDSVEVEYDTDNIEEGIKIKKIYICVSRKYTREDTAKMAYDEKSGHAHTIEEINIKNAVKNFYKIDTANIIYEER